MIVVDAAAMLDLLLQTPRGPAVQDRIQAEDGALHAPHVIDIEVAQVLRRYFIQNELTAERGFAAIVEFGNFDITRYPQTELLPRIWRLRDNLTAFDAAYVALAEILDAPLLTTDARIAVAAGHSVAVVVIGPP